MIANRRTTDRSGIVVGWRNSLKKEAFIWIVEEGEARDSAKNHISVISPPANIRPHAFPLGASVEIIGNSWTELPAVSKKLLVHLHLFANNMNSIFTFRMVAVTQFTYDFRETRLTSYRGREYVTIRVLAESLPEDIEMTGSPYVPVQLRDLGTVHFSRKVLLEWQNEYADDCAAFTVDVTCILPADENGVAADCLWMVLEDAVMLPVASFETPTYYPFCLKNSTTIYGPLIGIVLAVRPSSCLIWSPRTDGAVLMKRREGHSNLEEGMWVTFTALKYNLGEVYPITCDYTVFDVIGVRASTFFTQIYDGNFCFQSVADLAVNEEGHTVVRVDFFGDVEVGQEIAAPWIHELSPTDGPVVFASLELKCVNGRACLECVRIEKVSDWTVIVHVRDGLLMMGPHVLTIPHEVLPKGYKLKLGELVQIRVVESRDLPPRIVQLEHRGDCLEVAGSIMQHEFVVCRCEMRYMEGRLVTTFLTALDMPVYDVNNLIPAEVHQRAHVKAVCDVNEKSPVWRITTFLWADQDRDTAVLEVQPLSWNYYQSRSRVHDDSHSIIQPSFYSPSDVILMEDDLESMADTIASSARLSGATSVCSRTNLCERLSLNRNSLSRCVHDVCDRRFMELLRRQSADRDIIKVYPQAQLMLVECHRHLDRSRSPFGEVCKFWLRDDSHAGKFIWIPNLQSHGVDVRSLTAGSWFTAKVQRVVDRTRTSKFRHHPKFFRLPVGEKLIPVPPESMQLPVEDISSPLVASDVAENRVIRMSLEVVRENVEDGGRPPHHEVLTNALFGDVLLLADDQLLPPLEAEVSEEKYLVVVEPLVEQLKLRLAVDHHPCWRVTGLVRHISTTMRGENVAGAVDWDQTQAAGLRDIDRRLQAVNITQERALRTKEQRILKKVRKANTNSAFFDKVTSETRLKKLSDVLEAVRLRFPSLKADGFGEDVLSAERLLDIEIYLKSEHSSKTRIKHGTLFFFQLLEDAKNADILKRHSNDLYKTVIEVISLNENYIYEIVAESRLKSLLH